MRSRFSAALVLLPVGVVAACDGRYVLADLQATQTTPSGGSAGAGTGGGGPSGGAGPGGAGSGGDFVPGGSGGSAGQHGLDITPSSLPDARLGKEYVVAFGATGGLAPYSFELVSGDLPRGLDLDSDGLLTGTPEEIGEFAFVVRVRDAEDMEGQETFQLRVGRSRWLAVETFPATASSQSLLSLVDLSDPESELVRIEGTSAHSSTFSPDGRWLFYYADVSATQRQHYLVDTSAPELKAEPLMITERYPCRWAPDSSKLACVENTGTAEEPVLELVYVELTSSGPGPRVPIGPAGGHVEFLTADTLVYVDENDEYARVVWSGSSASAPVPLGIEGGPILQVAPDRRRAYTVLQPATEDHSAVRALIDFSSGEMELLPDHRARFDVDSTLTAAVAVDSPQSADAFGTYFYYALKGIEATLVLQVEAEHALNLDVPFYALAGGVVVREKNDAIVVVDVSEANPVERIVPGEYDHVRSFTLDSRGEWLCFVTVELDENKKPIPETARFWLSQIQGGRPSPAVPIGGGFFPVSFDFSPNGKRLVLHGYDSSSASPVEYRLYDIENLGAITEYDLDLPFNWSNRLWSDDSSFVYFIGGAPLTSSRPLFVVDALAPATEPRLIIECFSNPSPLPGCPNIAKFQP